MFNYKKNDRFKNKFKTRYLNQSVFNLVTDGETKCFAYLLAFG